MARRTKKPTNNQLFDKVLDLMSEVKTHTLKQLANDIVDEKIANGGRSVAPLELIETYKEQLSLVKK